MKKGLLLMTFLFFFTGFAVTIPEAFCEDSVTDVLLELLSNPVVLFFFLVQLGLGFGLGYFSMKALKYIIAILCLLTLGILLNIWQFGGLQGFLGKIGYTLDFAQLTAMLSSIASLLGILTILPIGVGFFIGVIVATRK